MLPVLEAIELTDRQFNEISELVGRLCGINLHDGKKELVKARLSKRLRALGLRDFNQYLAYINSEHGPEEIALMLDAVSTNLTFFFRESTHLEYLRDEILPVLSKRPQKKLRIWSAGCSSGEEPYSIAMTLCDYLGDIAAWDARILATDLSTRVLAACKEGVYSRDRFRQTPQRFIDKYFDCIHRGQAMFKVSAALRRLVTFARLNLMETWPMKGPFDVIFCRNVMIYFDKATQGRLVERFYNILAPGGILMIGHSESLTGVKHKFHYVRPTIYRK